MSSPEKRAQEHSSHLTAQICTVEESALLLALWLLICSEAPMTQLKQNKHGGTFTMIQQLKYIWKSEDVDLTYFRLRKKLSSHILWVTLGHCNYKTWTLSPRKRTLVPVQCAKVCHPYVLSVLKQILQSEPLVVSEHKRQELRDRSLRVYAATVKILEHDCAYQVI